MTDPDQSPILSPSGRFEAVRSLGRWRVYDNAIGARGAQPADLMRGRTRDDALQLMAELEAKAYPPRPPQQAELFDLTSRRPAHDPTRTRHRRPTPPAPGGDAA